MPKIRTKYIGFTLIELLVVIAIIGILSAISVVSLQGAAKRAENNSMLAQMENIKPLIIICQETGESVCGDCTLDYYDEGISGIWYMSAGDEICNGEIWPEPIKNWEWQFYMYSYPLGVNWLYKASRTDGSADIFCEDWHELRACRLNEY